MEKEQESYLAEVRQAITTTSTADLTNLAHHSDVIVRTVVAENTHTSQETLLKLATDNEQAVRDAVINNSTTPPSIAAIAALTK